MLHHERHDIVVASVRDQQASNGSPVLPPVLIEFVSALRAIHILGQVLKGATGTMPGARKSQVLAECYELAMRASASIVEMVVKQHAEIANELAQVLLQQRPELEGDLAAVRSTVREFLLTICESVVYNSVLQVSHATGARSLERTYERLLEERPEEAFRLFDLAIHMDHFEKFPAKRLQELESEFGKKPAQRSVLRRLVWRHLYLFQVPRDIKQSLCSRYDIKEKHVAIEREKAKAK